MKQYIDGALGNGAGDLMHVYNPATGQEEASFSGASSAHVKVLSAFISNASPYSPSDTVPSTTASPAFAVALIAEAAETENGSTIETATATLKIVANSFFLINYAFLSF